MIFSDIIRRASVIFFQSGLVQKLVDENASTTLDQTEYRNRYDGYADRCDKTKKRSGSVTGTASVAGAQGQYSERLPL